MDKYLDSFREMISLRGLTAHTLKNYCTYIRACLDYPANILHKSPQDVSWDELRDYIRWLQKSRDLSDRTINCAISHLRLDFSASPTSVQSFSATSFLLRTAFSNSI